MEHKNRLYLSNEKKKERKKKQIKYQGKIVI